MFMFEKLALTPVLTMVSIQIAALAPEPMSIEPRI